MHIQILSFSRSLMVLSGSKNIYILCKNVISASHWRGDLHAMYYGTQNKKNYLGTRAWLEIFPGNSLF